MGFVCELVSKMATTDASAPSIIIPAGYPIQYAPLIQYFINNPYNPPVVYGPRPVLIIRRRGKRRSVYERKIMFGGVGYEGEERTEEEKREDREERRRAKE